MSAADLRTDPTDEELDNIGLACQHLWDLDVNRMVPDKDYALNLQGGKKPYQTYDVANEKLFKFLDREKFMAIPTFKAFYLLLDNYERSTGAPEDVTAQEKRENWDFLDAAMEMPVMKFCHKYLVAKDLSDQQEKEFKWQLYKLWFYLYRREVRNDSSGFEHVFVGEERDGKVSGMHNWIQLFVQERKGMLDYRGYIYPRRRGRGADDEADDDQHILTLQFAWGAELKSVSTSFIGVSPEFEIALYTMCFLSGQEETQCHLDDFDVRVRCHRIAGNKIGTSYPEIIE